MVDTISISDRMSSTSSVTIGPPPPSTTISTIALQCGMTRVVVALLQSRDSLTLRVLEMSPNLAALGRNEENSKEMLSTHEDVLEKLRSKQSPVEELLRQADTLVSNQNPDIYVAMADCLGNAWRDLNSKLELRREILQMCSVFHKHRQICLSHFMKLNTNKKDVLTTYGLAVDEGRSLIGKLKEAGKEMPEEASYSISLVNAWLDELQQSRIQWQSNLKKQVKQERDAEQYKGFEEELKQIESDLKKGQNLDELRNQLLKLYSNIEKSDLSATKKSMLQRQIYNLIEGISIMMEVEEEITIFIKTFVRLDEVTFKKRYEDKLLALNKFDPKHEHIQVLRNRLSIRKSYEEILEKPLDYTDDEARKLIGQDPTLEITSALEKVKEARKILEQSICCDFENEIIKLENETKDATKEMNYNKLQQLKQSILVVLDQAKRLNFTTADTIPIIQRCENLQKKIDDIGTQILTTTEFIDTRIVLDTEEFREGYGHKLQDVKSWCPEAEEIISIFIKRIEIRTQYEAILQDPLKYSEADILGTLNQDPMLDTKGAFNKILLVREKKIHEAEAIQREEEVRIMEELQKQKEDELRRALEEAQAQEEQEKIQRQQVQEIEDQVRRQKELENELQRQRQLQAEQAEQKRLADIQRQAELEDELQIQKQITDELQNQRELEADLIREKQLAQLEFQAQAERESLKKVEEEYLKQRLLEAELDKQRQIEEDLHRQRQVDAELQRQLEIEEYIRQVELETQLRTQIQITEELELQRQLETHAQREKHVLQENLQLEAARQKQKQIEIEFQKQQELEAELKRQKQLEEELERQRRIEAETERQRQEEEFKRQQQLESELNRQKLITEELEKQRQAEEGRQRQRQIETEVHRQQEIEEGLRKQRELDDQFQAQLQIEAELQQQLLIQEEFNRQQQIETEIRSQQLEEIQRQASEQQKRDLDEYQRQRKLEEEQKLDELFRTLDFPLPENLEIARNDLGDFEKFESIVDGMENPPPELIEKMFEKKDNIIRCLRLYELYERIDRVVYIKEIQELEYELFRTNNLSEQIRIESGAVLPTSEASIPQQFLQCTEYSTFENSSQADQYVMSLSDNEVQAIFEKSTMETQTAEYGTPLANTQTQTDTQVRNEPIVLVMQEPAKILSTSETQTSEPVLPVSTPEPVHRSYMHSSEEATSFYESEPTKPKQTLRNAEMQTDTATDSVPVDTIETQTVAVIQEPVILREQEPAKILSTIETQTQLEPVEKRAEAHQLYFHETVEESVEECSRVEPIPALINDDAARDNSVDKTTWEEKRLSDIETQTHEPSPQLLRNSESQTKLTDFALIENTESQTKLTDFALIENTESQTKSTNFSQTDDKIIIMQDSVQTVPPFVSYANRARDSPAREESMASESARRPSVRDRVQALDTQIRRESQTDITQDSQTYSTGSRIGQLKENFVKDEAEQRRSSLPADLAELGTSSTVSTYRQVFESYEGYEISQGTNRDQVETSAKEDDYAPTQGILESEKNVDSYLDGFKQQLESSDGFKQQLESSDGFKQQLESSDTPKPISTFVEGHNITDTGIPIGKAVQKYRQLFESMTSEQDVPRDRTKTASPESILKKTAADSQFRTTESFRASCNSSVPIYAPPQHQSQRVEIERPESSKSFSDYKSCFDRFETSASCAPKLIPEPAYKIREVRSSSRYDSSNQKYHSSYSEEFCSQGVPAPPLPSLSLDSQSEVSKFKTFHERARPRPQSALSRFDTPQPSKFVPAKFTESDYESDNEPFKIEPIWRPPGSRPQSAMEFRTLSPAVFAPVDYNRTFRTSAFTYVQGATEPGREKPVPPPKPILRKPIAMFREPEPQTTFKQKPIPPPKPLKFFQPAPSQAKDVGNKSPVKVESEQVRFELEEPLSDSLLRQTQLTSTLTKTEECKFILRPIKSPSAEIDYDEELQVRKSPMNYYVSVTSPPITTPAYRTAESTTPSSLTSESRTYSSRETFQEEKSFQSFQDSSTEDWTEDEVGLASSPLRSFQLRKSTPGIIGKSQSRPKSEEFMRSSLKLESISHPASTARPKSTEFTRTFEMESTGCPTTTDVHKTVEFEHLESRPKSREMVHEIKIYK